MCTGGAGASEAPPAGGNNRQDLEKDPCSVEWRHWVDRMDSAVTQTVCGLARWFDNLFGGQRLYDESNATFGRLGLGMAWDERDDEEAITRFRGKFHFPKTEQRLNALVGFTQEDEFIEGDESVTETAADLFEDEQDEWLLGLQYHPLKGEGSKLSFSAGASFSSGFSPYIRARYRFTRSLSRTSLRIRLTPMWRDDRGGGGKTDFTVDHALGGMILRYQLTAEWFERQDNGFTYAAGTELYQNLGNGRALRYSIAASGEGDLRATIQEISAKLTWRRDVYERKLFIEAFGGPSWRREPDELESSFDLGLLLELKFGQ